MLSQKEETPEHAYSSTAPDDDDHTVDRSDDHAIQQQKHHATIDQQEEEQKTRQSELKSDYDSKVQTSTLGVLQETLQQENNVVNVSIGVVVDHHHQSKQQQPELVDYDEKSTESLVRLSSTKKNDEQQPGLYHSQTPDSLSPVRLNMKSSKPVEMPKAALEDTAVIGTYVLGSMEASTSCPSSPSTLSLKSVTALLDDDDGDDDEGVCLQFHWSRARRA